MSTKLQIRIKKLIDPELDLKLDYGELIRLSILIRFKMEAGWSKLYEAIIGFKDLLETFTIHFDIKSDMAYLEE